MQQDVRIVDNTALCFSAVLSTILTSIKILPSYSYSSLPLTPVNGYNAEIFATHWENMIRAENGIKLRAYYGIGSAGFEGQILVSGSSLSMFYSVSKNALFDGAEEEYDVPYHYGLDIGKEGYKK